MEIYNKKKYPKIKVEKKNIGYAILLLEDYAGRYGELNTIEMYAYQNFSVFNKYPEIAEQLIKIAKVEMKHLELLGKIINLLGVKPKYKTYRNGYSCDYNSSYVNYNTQIEQLLKYNIKIEIIAVNNYKKHMAMIKDKYIKEILKVIIEDELEHIKIFKEMLLITKRIDQKRNDFV